jgi:hypothetical protein
VNLGIFGQCMWRIAEPSSAGVRGHLIGKLKREGAVNDRLGVRNTSPTQLEEVSWLPASSK